MSASQVPVDDIKVLRKILDNTDALLLDFDGPICSVFTGKPVEHVARRLRAALAEVGNNELPNHIANSADPFDVFRYAATIGEKEAHHVETALLASEVEAIEYAQPTPQVHAIMHEWTATNRPIAIVSNNSESCSQMLS